jgi:hypothetical protein
VTTHVLLLLPDTALVPRLSVLSSASKVRDSQDASIGRDPGHPGGGEPRSKVDVEATVSVKQSRSRSIELDVLVSSDGHGDLGTILRGVEDLATMKKMSRDVSVRFHDPIDINARIGRLACSEMKSAGLRSIFVSLSSSSSPVVSASDLERSKVRTDPALV